MSFCASCKAILKEGETICNSCGLLQNSHDTAQEELIWTGQARMITNPEVIRGYLLLLAVMICIGGFISFISGSLDILFFLIFPVTLIVILLLFLLTVVLQILTGGLMVQGEITVSGVAHHAGSLSRSLHLGTLILGALGGFHNPRGGSVTTGGALIALSQEDNFIGWSDVKSVQIYPRYHLIVVRSGKGINPVALYCTRENFNRAVELMHRYASKTTRFL